MASVDAEKILVTEANYGRICESIAAADQKAEVKVGQTISTWPITYENGQRGQMTIFHDVKRGAVAFGGPSIWGYWDDEARILHADDGGDYNELGEEVNADEDDEDDE